MIEDIKKTLWATADKLRANMDAAEYKHIVLGLIFVKYISDTFQTRRAELARKFLDAGDDYFLDDAGQEQIDAELEDRDYYKEVNVFWVPEAARWESLRAQAKQADIGRRIDDALALIETENPKLKGILDKRYARVQLPDGKLGELVDLVSQIGFGESADVAKNHARDLLGQVYEYFLGQFASAEGKRGGQFYTPASIVKTLVAVLAPHHGQVYDPCCGSGGMFVQSEKFIEAHGGKLGDVSIYGQEANPTTWRLAAMNLAIRGIDFNLGKEPADTFVRNQHPDLRADFVLANPPFNISDWWHGSLEGDPRWVYGTPPQGNANYAWLQHMLHHLKPTGRAGIVLANGSMSSSQNSEGEIRRAMVEADKVEVMIALPGQLFFNTQIPACLWFLVKEKRARQGEVLFIDARKLGSMISRVQCEFTDDVIDRIANTVAAWRGEDASGEAYADVAGYCRSVTLEEIAEHGHVLTPGRYVGTEAVEDDDEGFADKMQKLTETLGEQMAKGAELDQLIRQKLGGLGMSSEWRTVEISSLCEGIFDGPHATPKKTECGPIFLGISSLNSGQLDLSALEYLSEEDFPKWTKRVVPKEGDLVFSYETRLGQAAIIPAGLRCCLGRRMALMRIDSNKAIPEYVLYAYLAPAFQDEIRKRTIHGSTVDRIPLTEFGKFPISVPSLNIQRQIVEILKSLDARITLLRETNITLEAIAQALFKSWFVDFDPVRAKLQGREPEGMDATTAALFPDSLEESELGLVPRGWRASTLDEISTVGIGKTPPRKEQHWFSENPSDVRWVSIRDMGISGAYISTTNEFLTAESVDRFNVRVVPDNTVMLSFKMTIGRVAISDGEMTTNEAIAHFKLDGQVSLSTEFIYLHLKQFDYSTLSSTSSIADAVNSKTVKSIPILAPSSEVLAVFQDQISVIFKKIKNIEQQIQTLATLRDTLLPRLISGQLRLPEAETQMTRAAA